MTPSFETAEDRARWMGYWHQIRGVLAVRPKRVLVIQSGDAGVTESYLEHAGVAVTSVAGLDDLPTGFDVVCAFDVLAPSEDLGAAVAKLAAASTDHVFLTLPYTVSKFRWRFWWGDRVLGFGPEWSRERSRMAQITTVLAEHADVVSSGRVAIRVVPDDPGCFSWHLRRRPNKASA